MAHLVCGISNEIPDVPVVSPVSGQIFERRLIEKFVNEKGTDPLTGTPLELDQLIPLRVHGEVLNGTIGKATVNGDSSSEKQNGGTLSATSIARPKPPSATSIPAIIKTLQDEWDAVMLHSFTLRQQLQTARQELSHALYQHDAACRVIARLTRELNAARDALATLKPQQKMVRSAAEATPLSSSGMVTPMTGHHERVEAEMSMQATKSGESDVTPDDSHSVVRLDKAAGMSQDIIDVLQEKGKALTGERKKRGKTVPADLASVDQIRNFVVRSDEEPVGLHSASAPGILACDVHLLRDRVVTGGADKNVVVFSRREGQVTAVLKGHAKKVTQVVYHPSTTEDVVLSASHDSTVRLWSEVGVKSGGGASSSQRKGPHVFTGLHSAPITSLSLHATGDYILATSTDGFWTFTDIRQGRLIAKVRGDGEGGAGSGGPPLTCGQFHPDGLILATGTQDSVVKMWDLKEQQNVANFEGHAGGPISAVAFSENGYYLATAAGDASVKLWDLRKLKNFHTINLNESQEEEGGSGDDGVEKLEMVSDLHFDQSGTYLSVACGSQARIYLCKQWTQLARFMDHGDRVTGVRFGRNAEYVTTCSMDRTLKFYSAS